VGVALDGRYELEALIGEGAFGRVYRGVDRRLQRPVAVKVIKPWWAEDSAWVERFQREAQMLARLNDPGIVQIFDIGHAEEGPYYVAELVPGESLAQRIERGPLALAQALAIAVALCRALAGAHARGIVHCDVKPANVLLTRAGKVKVGDFGVARIAGGTSQLPTATVAGTPRYMAPEQARGLPMTPATDVYSAGVVVYEMLAGRPPFLDGAPVELGLRHLQEQPPPLPETVPAAVRAVVERALAKEPRDRYPDAGAMAGALDAVESPPQESADTAVESPPQKSADTAVVSRVAEEDGAGPTVPHRGGDAPTRALRGGDAPTRSLRDGDAPTRALRRAGPPRAPRTQAVSEAALVGPGAPAGPPAPVRRARRRRWALLAGAFAVLLLAAAGATALLHGGAHTTVPRLRGLPFGGVVARARRLHVRPSFSRRFSSAPVGIALAQDPEPGVRVAENATVRVVLSAGPPPVKVPGVVGQDSESAETEIAEAGLRYAPRTVAAPGREPGTVTAQSPDRGATVRRGSTIALSVAEQPSWHTLTSFSGVDDGHSVPLRILGKRWRVNYSMAYEGTCELLVVCFGPKAEAKEVHGGDRVGHFKLDEGSEQSHEFDSGPGEYELTIAAGQDSARWSMTVEDYY
jgi:serine/threonine-protein kinase